MWRDPWPCLQIAGQPSSRPFRNGGRRLCDLNLYSCVGTLRAGILIVKIVDLGLIGELGVEASISATGEQHRVGVDGIHAASLLSLPPALPPALSLSLSLPPALPLLLSLPLLLPLSLLLSRSRSLATVLSSCDNRRKLVDRLVQGICFCLNTGRLVDEIAVGGVDLNAIEPCDQRVRGTVAIGFDRMGDIRMGHLARNDVSLHRQETAHIVRRWRRKSLPFPRDGRWAQRLRTTDVIRQHQPPHVP